MKPEHPCTRAERPTTGQANPESDPPGSEDVKIGSALDHLIGTWTEQEEESFLEAMEVFEEVDPMFWG